MFPVKGDLKNMKNPGTAAVLSLFIPGVGQIYNGTIWRGIFWLIITPGFWIGTGGTLGWVCHLIAAWTAYNYAQKQQRWAVGAK
jgi:TM2 domain-containing membrane protein YozV